MNKDRITVSFELLFLNDLFSSDVIDKNLYDMAVKKIVSGDGTDRDIPEPSMLATA